MLSLIKRENKFKPFLISIFFKIRKYAPINLIAFILIMSLSSTTMRIDHKYSFPPDSKDTIYVYDTVFYYDTTYVYDTVYRSEIIRDTVKIISKYPEYELTNYNDSSFDISYDLNINDPHKKYLFSLDLSFSPIYSLHKFTSDHLYRNVADLNRSSVKPLIGNEFGLNLNFHRKRSVFSSGLAYTTIREEFNLLATDIIIDSVLKYNYFTVETMLIDSVPLINIDTLLATGDTVYYFHIDTFYNTYVDSTLVYKQEIKEEKYNDHSKNSYKYIEIPLKYSFVISRPNSQILPEIGIITGFFVNSKGKIVSLANLTQSELLGNETKFAKVNLSLYTGIKFKYLISKRIDFFTSAFYRTNIHSVFRDYPIISSFNNYGFSFGIRYKFLL